MSHEAKLARALTRLSHTLDRLHDVQRRKAEPEKIAAAAIRVDGVVWALPPPSRHHVLIQAWAIAHYRDGENGRIGEHDQGFVTDTGRFVERDEAKIIARAAGQLLERASTSRDLFSEDVW